MRVHITRGSSFAQTLGYVAPDGNDQRELIGGTAADRNLAETVQAFAVIDAIPRRPNVQNLVFHASLSLPPGERLTDNQWNAIGRDFLTGMGLAPDNHLHAIAKHTDTDCEHVHIVASRLGLNAEVWLGQFEARRAQNLMTELEQKHGLQQTAGRDYIAIEKWEKKHAQASGKPALKQHIAQAVDAAIAISDGTLQGLQVAAKQVGVDIAYREASGDIEGGPTVGVSYAAGGAAFAGGKLGPGYKLDGIKRRLDAERSKRGLTTLYPGAENAVIGGSHAPAVAFWSSQSGATTEIKPGLVAVHIKSAVIKDSGERLVLERTEEKQAIELMVAAAKARNWTQVKVTGSSTFKRSAGAALREAGIEAHITPNPAAKRERKARGGHPPTIERGERWQQARQTSPAGYLRGRGYTVKETQNARRVEAHSGADHISAYYGDKAQSWFVARGAEVSGVLDFIIRDEGLSGHKVEQLDKAAEQLIGLSPSQAMPLQTRDAKPVAPKFPKLPNQTAGDAERGRQYLQGRGIDAAIIRLAEQAGALAYDSKSVIFTGRDSANRVRYGARRFYQNQPDKYHPGKTYNKRDLVNSNKSYPMLIPAQNDDRLVIVEGGADALAVQTLALKQGRAQGLADADIAIPAVMTTGGGNVTAWADRAEIQAKISRASEVVMWREREAKPETQAVMDKAHEKQRAAVETIRRGGLPQGRAINVKTPPVGYKDVAELNVAFQQKNAVELEV